MGRTCDEEVEELGNKRVYQKKKAKRQLEKRGHRTGWRACPRERKWDKNTPVKRSGQNGRRARLQSGEL